MKPQALSRPADLDALSALLADGGVAVLSGAGMSTDSGIPDYRGPSGAQRTYTPMTYHSFTHDAAARHRYWARSYIGWPRIERARPNDAHRGVAALQARGLLSGIVTQNVDGLHQAGGAHDIIELHGGLDRTVCLNCGAYARRADVGRRLRAANPNFQVDLHAVNPDGDAELADDQLDSFVMIDCSQCGSGPLKPDVVFFGETVPRQRVDDSFALIESSRALMVLGSSLTVMSGYRFVLRAVKLGLAVAIVNQGPTRGDAHATLRVDAPLSQVLSELAVR